MPIKRDLKRENSVGQKVIRGMYMQFLQDEAKPVVTYTPGLPYAIICDIDGTLAEHHRSPFDYDSLDTDTLIEPIAEALKSLAYNRLESRTVIIVSGGRILIWAVPSVGWRDMG